MLRFLREKCSCRNSRACQGFLPPRNHRLDALSGYRQTLTMAMRATHQLPHRRWSEFPFEPFLSQNPNPTEECQEGRGCKPTTLATMKKAKPAMATAVAPRCRDQGQQSPTLRLRSLRSLLLDALVWQVLLEAYLILPISSSRFPELMAEIVANCPRPRIRQT